MGFLRKELPYEELGYMYADSILPTLVDDFVNLSATWPGRRCGAEEVGRELVFLALAIFQMSQMNTVPEEYASSRVLGGFMQRAQERYENFAFDPTTSTVAANYIRIAARDLSDKKRVGSFPTLVPYAAGRITGLPLDDGHWPTALGEVDAFIQRVLQTATQFVEYTKANAKLV